MRLRGSQSLKQQQESLKTYKYVGTRAAAVIAKSEDATSITIRNRLQLARAGKHLNTLGKGARR